MAGAEQKLPAGSSAVAATPYTMKQQFVNTSLALFSGAVAGAVSRTATSPLERLKVMRQVQHSGQLYTQGVVGALVAMYKNEGLLSMWKGNGTNVARIAPSSAVQFFSFDVYKRILLPNDEVAPLKTLAAGGLAGATAAFICYPLDLVRSFLSVQVHDQKYKGIGGTMVQIVKSEGFFGLYRGLTPTLVGIAPYVAINFTVFDILKRKYLPSQNHPWFNVINFSLGACAGGVAATLTYPTDLVRRRMQLQGFKGFDLPRYTGMIDCVTQMVKTEGIMGLYKGMVPCWLKVVPSMAIAFMIYEGMRKTLKFDPPKGNISKS